MRKSVDFSQMYSGERGRPWRAEEDCQASCDLKRQGSRAYLTVLAPPDLFCAFALLFSSCPSSSSRSTNTPHILRLLLLCAAQPLLLHPLGPLSPLLPLLEQSASLIGRCSPHQAVRPTTSPPNLPFPSTCQSVQMSLTRSWVDVAAESAAV